MSLYWWRWRDPAAELPNREKSIFRVRTEPVSEAVKGDFAGDMRMSRFDYLKRCWFVVRGDEMGERVDSPPTTWRYVRWRDEWKGWGAEGR